MGSEKEIVAIVDEGDRLTGSATRVEMRRCRLIHRASYILVFNANDDLFIQKRTATKDIYPGYWDVAAGGVVLSGESYEEAAVRELEEELGVTAEKMTHLFDNFYEDAENRVWGRVFSCRHDGSFTLQDEEVESGRFMSIKEVLELSEREPFTPDGMIILNKLSKKIIADGKTVKDWLDK